MKRLDYIDTMKGIAIILVLLYHTIDLPEKLSLIVNVLHNPTFFLASGILLAHSLTKKSTTPKRFFSNKIRTLLYPFLLWIFIYSSLSFITKNESNTFFNHLIVSINRLWFLPTLFFSSTVIYAYYNYTNDIFRLEKFHNFIIYPLCFLIGLYSSSLGKTAFFTYIVWIGLYFSKKLYDHSKVYSFFHTLIFITYLFFVCKGYILLNDTVVPGIKLNFYLSASILGAFMILLFSKKITLPILTYFGKNSLYFYILHFLALEFRDTLLYFFPNSTFIFSFANGAITFILSILIPVLIIPILKINMIRKILFGK